MATDDKYAAAIWTAAKFLFEQHSDDQDMSDPAAVLATAREEIEREIAAMLRGVKSNKVMALCAGAVAIREFAPTAREWIAATAPLRAPCAQREYCRAFDWFPPKRGVIKRVAAVLTSERKVMAAQALWLIDQPQRRAA